jgi:CzcA family heavy metal efflux pump
MNLLDRVIRWSVERRLFVLVAACAFIVYGAFTALRMPVDVFPDLTAPTVTVVTEAHGLAPEEVESLVTFPVEAAMNGATGVRRVRSASGIGISIVWVEFDWGTDIHVARQIVTEKLQTVARQIPGDIAPPTLAPVSSIMGEILFVGLTSSRHEPVEVREAAEWLVRKRLLAVGGVAQVVPTGGARQQIQVLVEPERMLRHQVSLDEVIRALEESNQNATGGFVARGAQERLVRAVGRVRSPQELEQTVVALRGAAPVLLRQVADVVVGPGIRRGEGSASARPAVVMGILKQPGANTLELTRRVDQALADIQKSLPAGMVLERELMRQADFIETSVGNVSVALRDGAILVAIILLLFLWNVRAAVISLAALPISLLVSIVAMRAMGITVNTMSLGGLTIAIGALVDDAIIDVENVFRRLRENRALPDDQRRPPLEVVVEASREVRGSIVFATLIVMLVFVPLFFLTGVEGRLLAPLGFAYLVAIFASLVVALTVTPALCAYLLAGRARLGHGDSAVVRWLKRMYRPVLVRAIAHPPLVGIVAGVLLVGALALSPFLGRTFLPAFNEGALTIGAVTLPGTSLDESDRLGRRLEQILLEVPEVESTARRTGRAELDEHAQDVNASEIDVRLRPGRPREEILADVRRRASAVPGMVLTIGQPIAHRIDHMLSGTRASIAVKIFGDDLAELRRLADQVRSVIASVDGAVDVSVEQQVDVPQLALVFDRDRIARYGLRAGALAEAVETAFAGHVVSSLLAEQRTYDVVVRYADRHRADKDAIGAALFDTPLGPKVPLAMLATIRDDAGPNTISRENVQRKMVVQANVGARDLGSVIDDIRAAIEREVRLPSGYYVVYGGQFESQEAAARTIAILGALVVAGIFLLLYLAFRSARVALVVMINLPLALVGGVVAALLGGGVLSIGSLVGFITLFGIATRNGIMMISHYEHLQAVERAPFADAVERGSLERLSPVLMTALCAGLALLPLVLAGGEPGNEIQAPMGLVILGGLLSSTALNMIVVPALYARLFRPRDLGP